MPDLQQLFQFLNAGGVLGLLLVILLGGARRWWVFGWAYDDMEKQRDDWKTMAENGARAAEHAVDIAERFTEEGRIPRRR